MHNYCCYRSFLWANEIQKKPLKVFICFQLITLGTYVSLAGENRVHWLIIQLIQKEVLVIMYSKKSKKTHQPQSHAIVIHGLWLSLSQLQHQLQIFPFCISALHKHQPKPSHPAQFFSKQAERLHTNSLWLPKELKSVQMFNGRNVK